MSIKLLVADDHTLVRQGLVKLLGKDSGLEVVGEADVGFEAISAAQRLQPDAVLMDIDMPNLDGISATRSIVERHPDVQVIIVTDELDESYVLGAVKAGARGFILKSATAASLCEQIKEVVAGGVAFSAEMTSKLIAGLTQPESSSGILKFTPDADLTAREKDVLDLIAQGLPNKTIAVKLFVSENTVRSHVRNLMQKLEMDNRTQLAVYALPQGYGLQKSDDNADDQDGGYGTIEFSQRMAA